MIVPLFDLTFTTFPGLDYELETDPLGINLQPVSGSALTADEQTETVQALLAPRLDVVRVRRK